MSVYSVSVSVFVLWLLQLQSHAAATEIECIPVKLCPMAMRLIKTKPYAPDTVAFLRYSHCGFADGEAKVWCNKFKYCLTPDSRNGTCKAIKECDSYIRFMEDVDTSNPVVKKYLKEFRCTTEFDPEVKVCCPEDKLRRHIDNEFRDLKHRSLDKVPNPRQQECERQSSDDRIFGGTETLLDEFPWMALLKYASRNKTQFGCGGALVTEEYVLTAAHCVHSGITRQKGVGNIYSVILGEYDTRNETDCFFEKYGKDCADPSQEFRVDQVIIHPDFSPTLMLNDIALIRLSGRVAYSDYIKPLCLPPRNMGLNGNETFFICGWGRTPTEKRSPVKRKAMIKNTSKNNCNEYNGRDLTDRQLCAGDGKGTDSCYGDSGGPLMLEKAVEKNLITFAVGIVSYGFGKMCGSLPGVYTYVPPYIEWIYENIG